MVDSYLCRFTAQLLLQRDAGCAFGCSSVFALKLAYPLASLLTYPPAWPAPAPAPLLSSAGPLRQDTGSAGFGSEAQRGAPPAGRPPPPAPGEAAAGQERHCRRIGGGGKPRMRYPGTVMAVIGFQAFIGGHFGQNGFILHRIFGRNKGRHSAHRQCTTLVTGFN